MIIAFCCKVPLSRRVARSKVAVHKVPAGGPFKGQENDFSTTKPSAPDRKCSFEETLERLVKGQYGDGTERSK